MKDSRMDDRMFSRLVREFRAGWLNQENYTERLALHRQPLVLKHEILRKLYDYYRDIQNRPEMRSLDLEGNPLSDVYIIIREVKNRDKRIRSLYDAILAYCLRSKADLLTIAVHMAECRAVDQLIRRFQRETIRAPKEAQKAKAAPGNPMQMESKEIGHNVRESNGSFFRFAEEHEVLKKKFMIEAPVTREEAEREPRLAEGQLIRRNPEIPEDPLKALELFKNYYARVQLLYQKDYFYNKYRTWNEVSVTAEIEAIEEWIGEVRKLSYSAVCERKDYSNEQHEFLRLENGYYEGYLMSWDQFCENSTAARVYGLYFHFLTYLKNRLFELIASRSNYRDANGDLIPEKLALPEVQRRILQENRVQIATLPLDTQWGYYQAILVTNVHRKKDYLSSGGKDEGQIQIYDTEIEAAQLELDRIERARSADQVAPKKDHKPERGPRPKPVFKEAVREQGFDILKHYFPANQQPELERILRTGDDTAAKLLFMGNGITLLDFFKRLQIGQLVVAASKSCLQSWIVRNITYGKQSAPKVFRAEYAERVLSGSEQAAKGKRLIDVVSEGGKWVIRQLPITNRAESLK